MIFLQATSGLPSHTFPIPKHPASKHLHTAHADAVRTPMHQHHLARVRSDNTGRRPMRTRRTQTYKARRRGSRMSIRSFKSFQPRQLTSCKYCAAGVWSPPAIYQCHYGLPPNDHQPVCSTPQVTQRSWRCPSHRSLDSQRQ